MKNNLSIVVVALLGLIFLSSCRVRKSNPVVNKTGSNKLHEIHIKKELKKEIDRWLGTPYKYGGIDYKGVDCSGFVHSIYLSVYHIQLPRSSKEMYAQSIKIKTKALQEGDLVFFNYNGKGVSHVGIYLNDDKYVHASTSKGVVVSSLSNPYTVKNYVGAGRFKK